MHSNDNPRLLIHTHLNTHSRFVSIRFGVDQKADDADVEKGDADVNDDNDDYDDDIDGDGDDDDGQCAGQFPLRISDTTPPLSSSFFSYFFLFLFF